jgi:hypothetical protein
VWNLFSVSALKCVNTTASAAAAAAAAAAAVQEATPLPAADAADLLQLAVNCRSTETASSAIEQLQHLLEPTATRRLLVTAFMRHRSAAYQLLEIPAVQEHLDGPTVGFVMRYHLIWMRWLLPDERARARNLIFTYGIIRPVQHFVEKFLQLRVPANNNNNQSL